VTQVNPIHTSFTVRLYFTVKEVRLHSGKGKATQWPGLLEQLLPCPTVVWGSQRVSCREYDRCALEAWLRDGGSGEAVFYARAPEGSGDTEPAPEAKGSGELELAPEAKGSGETEPAPKP